MSVVRAVFALGLIAACGVTAPTPRATHTSAARGSAPLPGASTRPDPRAVGAVADPEPEPPALRLPDDVVPTAYRVRWVVDADREAFTGHVDIDVDVRRATDHVWLNAVGL